MAKATNKLPVKVTVKINKSWIKQMKVVKAEIVKLDKIESILIK